MVFGLKTMKISKNLYLLEDKTNLSNLTNSEEYVRLKLKALGFIINKSRRSKNIGVPDFFYEGDAKSNPFYIEVKTKSDGLRFEQLLWISKNSKEKVYIYYVNQKCKSKIKVKTMKKTKICYYCSSLKNADEIIKTRDNRNICRSCREHKEDKNLK